MSDWSAHCGDLAAQAVRPKHLERLGPMPRSWREAAALYRRLGVRNLAGAVTVVLGPPIPRRRAMRGDVVMVRGSLGICRGEVVECVGATVRIGEVEAAWSARGDSDLVAEI